LTSTGAFSSHFELYRAAMEQCGADVSRIDSFVDVIRCRQGIEKALAVAAVPPPARRFVQSTFDTIDSGSVPRIAAAFTLGREDVIPDMFRRLVADLSQETGGQFALFLHYLERHIRIDGEEHG